MNRKVLLASVALIGLSTPTFGADFSCKPYEKFSKKSEADQVRLMEKSIGASTEDWTAEQLNILKKEIVTCAEKRKAKVEKKKAIGGLLGAIGGAVSAKSDQRNEAAVAGAAATTALFEGTKDKKLLSFQAALKQIENSSLVLARKDGSATTPPQTTAQATVPGLSPEQVRLARQSVYDGNEQVAYQTCGNDAECRKRINEEMEAERKRWRAQMVAKNRQAAAEKEAQKLAAKQKEEQKRADIEKRAPAYVQQAIEQNAGRLAKAGFSDEILDSSYRGVPLRAYLSVLLSDPNVRVFSERHLVGPNVVVVKPAGKRSSKYYFEMDYGDLTPKAIELPQTTGLRLVELLPEKEFTFATNYFAPYWRQIESGLGY